MEIMKIETEAVSKIEADSLEQTVAQLGEFQLALVGGGCGEVLFG